MLPQNKLKLSEIKPEVTIDAKGLLCPLPVLKLRKILRDCVKGSIVKLIADDPAAEVDVAHFCNETGNIFIGAELEKTNNNINNDSSKKNKPLAYYVKKLQEGPKGV